MFAYEFGYKNFFPAVVLKQDLTGIKVLFLDDGQIPESAISPSMVFDMGACYRGEIEEVTKGRQVCHVDQRTVGLIAKSIKKFGVKFIRSMPRKSEIAKNGALKKLGYDDACIIANQAEPSLKWKAMPWRSH